MNTLRLISLLASLTLLACGCSNVAFTVKHDPLKNPPAIRQGTLSMGQFVDKRSVTNAMQIGGKWKKAKPAYLAKQQRPVVEIVRDGMQEALQKVGYQVDSNAAVAAPLLDGELTQFWLTDNWGGAVCNITLETRLRDGAQGKVLWQHRFLTEEDDWVVIPNAMVAAFNTLLKQAMEEFSSPEFAKAVTEAGPNRKP